MHPRQQQRILREYERADLVRVMSRVAAGTFLERGFSEDRLVVAHPPMAIETFPEARFRHPVFRVSYAGLLEPWKGFHYLVEAFQSLNLPDSELVLWGGPGSRPVNRFLCEHVGRNPAIRVRPVEIRRVGFAEVYGQSNVLVHPSLSDGFGFVVAEAMACGVPVIVTPCTGAADLVEDGYNGFIVPPRDIEALRERLRHLARNPDLCRQMGQTARRTLTKLTLEAFQHSLLPRIDALAA